MIKSLWVVEADNKSTNKNFREWYVLWRDKTVLSWVGVKWHLNWSDRKSISAFELSDMKELFILHSNLLISPIYRWENWGARWLKCVLESQKDQMALITFLSFQKGAEGAAVFEHLVLEWRGWLWLQYRQNNDGSFRVCNSVDPHHQMQNMCVCVHAHAYSLFWSP